MRATRWGLFCGITSLTLACATRNPRPVSTPIPAPSATAAASPAVPSAAEAQAALLELEDRRAFDEPALRSLAGGDPATRSRTALAIGRIGDERGGRLLESLLADPLPEVRASAAFSAGLLRDGGLTGRLGALLADPDLRVASAAAKALGFSASPEAETILIEALGGASVDLRPVLLASLWRFSDAPSEAALLPYAADAGAPVRSAAIYALARKPRLEAAAALTAALADPAPDTAAIAARGLGVIGRAESAAPLAAALDGRTPVVINALLALEALFEKTPGARLSEDRRERILALAGEANPNVAVPAIALLRQFAAIDREASRRLWSIGLSGEGRRRETALVSLAAAFRGGAQSALDAAAGSPDPFLRAAAAEACGFLAVPDARAYRDRFSADKEVVVRLANLDNLKTADAVRESRPLVNSALTDPDPGVRAAAIEDLSRLDDASTLALYAEAAEKARAEAAPDVAIAVIAACEKRKGDPAAAAIVESIYREGRTLPARLARRALVATFGRPADGLPQPEYRTGKSRSDYAAIVAETSRRWRAAVETGAGVFTIRLAGTDAPMTVANFLRLARAHYFDGVRIHRVVPNFVLQDGDPTATGNGGPGYEIRDEINPLEYSRGAVGMALSGPDTGGSQWFATHSPQPHLNGLYTIFGHVGEGQAVMERIAQGEKILRVTVSDAP